jgi:hypothetical protein
VKLRDELEALALDFLFGFGVAKVGIEPRGDYGTGTGDQANGVMGNFTMEALTPFAVRLNPANVVIDPQADSYKTARFIAPVPARPDRPAGRRTLRPGASSRG